jgi:hypothetical protein
MKANGERREKRRREMATSMNVTQFPVQEVWEGRGRPLAKKLATVLSEVHRVPKNGRNDFHGYDYVTESDLVDHIRDKLAEQGVAIFPSVRDHHVAEMQDARNRTVYLTTVTLDVTLMDGESGDVMTTTWIGQGLDNGDKGYYKAYTGAVKYFLLKTFLISTGDDPERDEAPRPEQGSKHGARAGKPTVVVGGGPSEGLAGEEDRWKERSSELSALLEESVDDAVADRFRAIYIARMGAQKLEEIDSLKLGAMCRKLRGMHAKERRGFVEGIIAEQDKGKEENA